MKTERTRIIRIKKKTTKITWIRQEVVESPDCLCSERTEEENNNFFARNFWGIRLLYKEMLSLKLASNETWLIKAKIGDLVYPLE